MCGIAGIWRFNSGANAEEIRDFTDSMYHRGPDGGGYELFEKDGLALGHRRLSTLDLTAAGNQPMAYADRRYWLSFNGEIYNFIELREELLKKGHQFLSDSDSEVVLAAYAEWGQDCFPKFNGMWAIAIWDDREKQLLLCRDRFGVKPLHYCFLPGKLLAFASETVAFRNLRDFRRTFDTDNLLRAMHSHNVLEPAGKTIYKEIQQVLPGQLLLLKHNRIARQTNWWKTLEHLPSVPSGFTAQKEKFLELFEDACRLRLRSDVPVASALSGGIDSTAVYCTLSKVMQQSNNTRSARDWQKAFSIAFPGSEVDERKYIESVLKQTKGEGIIVEPTADNLATELQKSTEMADFISGTPLPCLTYVYKAMRRQGIVVSMDGHGADEYLYGYQTSVAAALANAYWHHQTDYAGVLEDTLRQMLFPGKAENAIKGAKARAVLLAQRKSGHPLKRLVKNMMGRKPLPLSYTNPAFAAGELYRNRILEAAVYPEVVSMYGKSDNSGEQQLLEEFHYIDLPYNLRDFDRGAMQHQIEIRMPFMDYRLVTYAMALPQQSKLDKGFTKYILRESMKGIMPEDIRTRKLKIGLGAPLADWFNGPLNVWMADVAASDKLRNSDVVDAQKVRNYIQTHCTGKSWTESSAQEIWPIINYLLLTEN